MIFDIFSGIICVCWIAGTLVGFLPLLGWNAGKKSNEKCIFTEVMDYDYLVFLYFATIIFPALLIAAFYAHIYRVVVKQVRYFYFKYIYGTIYACIYVDIRCKHDNKLSKIRAYSLVLEINLL